MSLKSKSPTDTLTVADLAEYKTAILKEAADIAREWPKLSDGDPTNNGPAILEIVESLGKIAATLLGAVAAAVYVAQSLGVM